MDNQLPGILDRYTPNPCNAEKLDVVTEFIIHSKPLHSGWSHDSAEFNEWRPSNYPWSLIVYRIKDCHPQSLAHYTPLDIPPYDIHPPGPESFGIGLSFLVESRLTDSH